jgi:hypothetical protein
MAMWFCEIACKRQMEGAKSAPRFADNPFLPRREKNRRVTMRLDELAAASLSRPKLCAPLIEDSRSAASGGRYCAPA